MTSPNIAYGQAVLAERPLLHDMLATDVQDYQPLLDDIATALARLQTTPAHPVPAIFTGNLYALTLHAGTAEIVNARDKSVPRETMPLADFAAGFAAWRQSRPQPD